MYYRGASAAILVYDITDASTFDDVRIWLEELKRNHHAPSNGDDPPLIIYIVGAKADLAAKKREVSQEQARKSLHTWFPPPPKEPPPSSKPSSSASSSYGRVGGLSYIRPRFPSLTATPTAPPPKVDNSVAAAALNRAKSARVVPVGTRLNGDASAPGDWRRPTAGVRERRWSDAMMWDDAMREEGYVSLRANNTSTPGDDGNLDSANDEELYPLEKGMELFEVSAKDNAGVQNLFAHLIDNIIRRRDLIESERVDRERNSVVLNPMPSWRNDTDGDASRTSLDEADAYRKNGGWSCCSS